MGNEHSNLCLVWDVEEIRAIGLPDHRQKVTILVVSTMLALRWIEENATKDRESKTYSDRKSRKLSIPPLVFSTPDLSSHSPRSIATPTSCLLPRWSPSADDRVIRLIEFLPRPTLNRGLSAHSPWHLSAHFPMAWAFPMCNVDAPEIAFSRSLQQRFLFHHPLMCCIVFLLRWDTIRRLPMAFCHSKSLAFSPSKLFVFMCFI